MICWWVIRRILHSRLILICAAAKRPVQIIITVRWNRKAPQIAVECGCKYVKAQSVFDYRERRGCKSAYAEVVLRHPLCTDNLQLQEMKFSIAIADSGRTPRLMRMELLILDIFVEQEPKLTKENCCRENNLLHLYLKLRLIFASHPFSQRVTCHPFWKAYKRGLPWGLSGMNQL